MASNINAYNIDGTFPIAGQDNPSQGFRDNFTNIKNNFIYAQNEITDIQNKALVTGALDGQIINNDMAGTQIVRPQLSAWTQSLISLGAVNGAATLDFNSANFQKITTAGPITLSFENWPASVGSGALGYGLMRVWVEVTNIAHTVTLPTSVTIGVDDIAGYNATTDTITFDATGNYVFDFSSIDGGDNYLIFDVTRNRSTLRDPSLYFNDTVNSTLLVGWREGLAPALLLNQGQSAISSRGSYNSAFVGNLDLANNTIGNVDGQLMSGYTVTTLRGNLTANTYTPVKSNDYLGYVNAVTYTGSALGTANAFQQVASINFYATGSNVTYGLGGNIALFTGRDGDSGLHTISQAVGIENDQSTKFYGNIFVANTFVPTSSTSGGTKGQISYNSGNIYICLGPNNWMRSALSSF